MAKSIGKAEVSAFPFLLTKKFLVSFKPVPKKRDVFETQLEMGV